MITREYQVKRKSEIHISATVLLVILIAFSKFYGRRHLAETGQSDNLKCYTLGVYTLIGVGILIGFLSGGIKYRLFWKPNKDPSFSQKAIVYSILVMTVTAFVVLFFWLRNDGR